MFIITEQELDFIRNAKVGTLQKKLYDSIKNRCLKNTQEPGLVQKNDTNMMEHICWSRASDAALIVAVEKDEHTARWLHDVIIDLCNQSAESWIGPWFRRKGADRVGQLETSHMSLAVSVALDLCPTIFSTEETVFIKESLREKGMNACRRFCKKVLEARGWFNNWFSVLLNGLGTSAIVLGDKEVTDEVISFLPYVKSLYQDDSYGESLQYCNYTGIHFCHLMEVLLRAGIPEVELPLETHAKLMPWFATSFMYLKPLEGWGPYNLPRSINFADSGAAFRPSGDVLMQCAARMKNTLPRESSLASYLFYETYSDWSIPYDEGGEFGFFNQFGIHSVVLANEMAEARSPFQSGLPLLNLYSNGNIHMRDCWESTKFILGVQGGYKSLNVSGHRHEDLNSFILSAFGERMFIDPGHCCYRLRTQAFSISSTAHNTWTFEINGNEIRQNMVDGNFFNRKEPIAEVKYAAVHDDGIVVSSDAAKAYGDLIERAERTFIVFAPHFVFIVDRIHTKEPAKVHTRFWGNNRGNKLSVNVASQSKLVFRRGNAAVKLFSMGDKEQSLGFDWGYVHDVYHPQPNQLGQGAEGSALGYCFSTDCETRCINIYAMAIDEEPKIKGWHMYKSDDGRVKIESPNYSYFREILVRWDGITVFHGDETVIDC